MHGSSYMHAWLDWIWMDGWIKWPTISSFLLFVKLGLNSVYGMLYAFYPLYHECVGLSGLLIMSNQPQHLVSSSHRIASFPHCMSYPGHHCSRPQSLLTRAFFFKFKSSASEEHYYLYHLLGMTPGHWSCTAVSSAFSLADTITARIAQLASPTAWPLPASVSTATTTSLTASPTILSNIEDHGILHPQNPEP
jgi:hypothetical protein